LGRRPRNKILAVFLRGDFSGRAGEPAFFSVGNPQVKNPEKRKVFGTRAKNTFYFSFRGEFAKEAVELPGSTG